MTNQLVQEASTGFSGKMLKMWALLLWNNGKEGYTWGVRTNNTNVRQRYGDVFSFIFHQRLGLACSKSYDTNNKYQQINTHDRKTKKAHGLNNSGLNLQKFHLYSNSERNSKKRINYRLKKPHQSPLYQQDTVLAISSGTDMIILIKCGLYCLIDLAQFSQQFPFL